MARERRLFSEEFKREAVKLAGQPGASEAGIARDLALALICWGVGAEKPTSTDRCAAARKFPVKSMSACGVS